LPNLVPHPHPQYPWTENRGVTRTHGEHYTLYAEWFKDFPNGDPTAEQLAEANGDQAVAEAKLTKAAKGVSSFSHVELLKTDHEDIPSVCVLLVLD
jgi:hypothetical protein